MPIVAAVLAAMAMLPVSCRKQGPEEVPVILQLRTPAAQDSKQQHINVEAESSWTLSVSYPEGNGSGWAKVEPNHGTGQADVTLSYGINDANDARTCIITLHCAGYASEYRFTQSGKISDGGTASGSALDITPVAVAPVSWLELPETKAGDGMDFVAHAMTTQAGVKTRNFSYYFNYDDRVAFWVAYPTNAAIRGSNLQGGTRTEAWGYDPFMESALQQDVSGGYREGNNGWYARGHQIPSYHRQGVYENNAMTFYGTNMTPQDNNFNGGTWANLENKISNAWTPSLDRDTLFCVTGCVTKNAKYYVYDRSGHQITVPTAYFKACLRYSSIKGVGIDGYMAAGFWFDHEEWSAESKSNVKYTRDWAISIDELEKKLGYKLFAALESRVGADKAAQIKTQDPKTVEWWR